MNDPTPRGGIKQGVAVVIGGKEYTAPPLNFGGIRDMYDQKVAHPYDLLVFVLVRSLERNYEGVNAQWIRETLEGSEIDDAAKAEMEILRLSGLKPNAETATGEAPAAA